ncbi:hypothetical protein [Tautonia rosea]|uniref:hypothetical protein n=1 Tax=Tautonia rosea TaxID=2728037 RepID=UPI001472FA81|nr:hypothetical protein [Tautonia rosea]
MIRTNLLLPIGAALLLIGMSTNAEAGGRRVRSSVPVVTGVPVASPTSAVIVPSVPVPTVARSPYLGTFRPDPTLVIRSGYNTGGGYSPGDLPTSYGSMSLYGPFSRLRSVPTEVVTYSRGYDGVLRPTSSGISYEYTNPALYPDTTLVPTRMTIDPSNGSRVRSGFGRYLLGQQ